MKSQICRVGIKLLFILILVLAVEAGAQQFINNPDCGEKEIGVIYPDGKKGCIGFTTASSELLQPVNRPSCIEEVASLKKRITTLEKRLEELEGNQKRIPSSTIYVPNTYIIVEELCKEDNKHPMCRQK